MLQKGEALWAEKGKLRVFFHLGAMLCSFIALGTDSMGDRTGGGMDRASLGCPLAEETAAAAETEKECVVSP